ncbi:MAG TPA: MFS transporter [Candidatus Binatia bacterium]|nr:MFS transporter [Candidatus Binatia bacterium]
METTLPVSYRSLLRVRGLPRIVLAALLGRTALQMLSVAMVLFVLERFHSTTLAGLAVFAYALPGVLVSPLAGALLDHSGRVPLIRLDYSIAGVAVLLILLLDRIGVLDPGLLIGIAVLGSLTSPLSSAGTRTLFPVLVPPALWDRANAVDSAGYVIAAVTGAPLAAVVAGLVGRPAALLATALVFLAAAASLVGVGRLTPLRPGGSLREVPGQAWAGLVYVARNPTLRGLAVSLSVINLASGLLIVAVPLLVLDRFHENAAVVGALWAVSAASGGVNAVFAGHRGSQDRERRMLVGGTLGSVLAVLLLAFAPNVLVAALAMLIWGGSGGWMDIGLFSVRQRRTDPAWYGRAFAVSMSLNSVGSPIGSAIAGPLLGPGLTAGLLFGALAALISAGICILMVPPRARLG